MYPGGGVDWSGGRGGAAARVRPLQEVRRDQGGAGDGRGHQGAAPLPRRTQEQELQLRGAHLARAGRRGLLGHQGGRRAGHLLTLQQGPVINVQYFNKLTTSSQPVILYNAMKHRLETVLNPFWYDGELSRKGSARLSPAGTAPAWPDP